MPHCSNSLVAISDMESKIGNFASHFVAKCSLRYHNMRYRI